MANLWPNKEEWSPDQTAWFEYHCWESDSSGDAKTWYHSHQQVKILSHDPSDHDCLRPAPWSQRSSDGGQPCLYRVQFADGYIADVFEDELLVDPKGYERPDPPKLEESYGPNS
jgi:hypothetical protein